MANNKSAEKRIRQTEVRRERKRASKSRMRTAVKNLRIAIEAGDTAKANELLAPTLRVIDETAQKKTIHGNTAARTKSRLARAVAGLA